MEREPDRSGREDSPSDEHAPLFGRWGVWYLLVVLDLALVIALCAWLTRRHP